MKSINAGMVIEEDFPDYINIVFKEKRCKSLGDLHLLWYTVTRIYEMGRIHGNFKRIIITDFK